MRSTPARILIAGLLVMTAALLASGCASNGSYSGSASVGVYGYGYYGGYPGYYGSNVVVGAPVHPGGVRPPGSMPPPSARAAPCITNAVASHAEPGPEADAARRGRASLRNRRCSCTKDLSGTT